MHLFHVFSFLLLSSSIARVNEHLDYPQCSKQGERSLHENNVDLSHSKCEKKCLLSPMMSIPTTDLCVCGGSLVLSEYSGNCVKRSECAEDFLKWHMA